MSVANFKDTGVRAFVFLKHIFILINYSPSFVFLPYLCELDRRIALSMGNFLCRAFAVFPRGERRPRVCPAENTDITHQSLYFTTRSTVIRNLKVVNRLDRVDTPNAGVSKAEQEFLVIFISVSEILANQQEVRFDSARRAGRVSRQTP